MKHKSARSRPQIAEWANAYAKLASPTNYNNTVALLRRVLNVAIEAAVIYSNPATALKRAAIRVKDQRFLIDLKQWRLILANGFGIRNQKAKSRSGLFVTNAVTRTLPTLRHLIRTSDCQRNATRPRACACAHGHRLP